jgi:hypothetical protein
MQFTQRQQTTVTDWHSVQRGISIGMTTHRSLQLQSGLSDGTGGY